MYSMVWDALDLYTAGSICSGVIICSSHSLLPGDKACARRTF